MPTISSVTQDPGAHLSYDIDWTDWLTRRGLDSSYIVTIVAVAASPLEITQTVLLSSALRIYVRGAVAGRALPVTVTMTCSAPDGGDALIDDFTFTVVGAQK